MEPVEFALEITLSRGEVFDMVAHCEEVVTGPRRWVKRSLPFGWTACVGSFSGEWAYGVDQAIGRLGELVAAGQAAAVVPLTEFALDARVEVMERADDSTGTGTCSSTPLPDTPRLVAERPRVLGL